MRLPSANHLIDAQPLASVVSRRASPPSGAIR